MSPLVYVFGIGLGILGFLLLRPAALTHSSADNRRKNNTTNSTRRRPYTQSEDEECVVCLEKMDEKKRLLCGHVLHPNCYIRLRKHFQTCPLCRQNL